jgi:hypothetical protein
MIVRYLAATVLTGLLLAACASTRESAANLPSTDEMLAQVTEQDGRACIRAADIDGYAPLDDSLVSVGGRRREHFLVTMMFRCSSLGTSMAVAFDGSFAEFCGGGNDAIRTRSERCPVRHIYRFPSRDDAFAALEAARARRQAQQLIPPDKP